MKNYKEFEKKYIGESDGATLRMVGGADEECNNVYDKDLGFGEDGAYQAYIVNEPAIIGEYYYKVATFYKIVRIFNEYMPQWGIAEFKADKINIYRAGNFGCIIELIND